MKFLNSDSPHLAVALEPLMALAHQDKRPDPVHWGECFCLSLSDEIDDSGLYFN